MALRFQQETAKRGWSADQYFNLVALRAIKNVAEGLMAVGRYYDCSGSGLQGV